IGALDDPGGVVVLGVQGEDQLGLVDGGGRALGLAGVGGGQGEQEDGGHHGCVLAGERKKNGQVPRRRPGRLEHPGDYSNAFRAAGGTSTLVWPRPLSVTVRTAVPSTSALPSLPWRRTVTTYLATAPSASTQAFRVPPWATARTSVRASC